LLVTTHTGCVKKLEGALRAVHKTPKLAHPVVALAATGVPL
jgi:hypothetical protein